MGSIFLLNSSDELVEMTEAPYDSEAVLQELLANYPSVLSGDFSSIDVDPRFLLIKREMAVPSDGLSGTWSLDHLFVDHAGIPTLVEVKQSKNSEIRRQVVGQLLDYAANAVVYWPVERLRAAFESSCESSGRDPDGLVAEVLGRPDVDAFWESVATNLQAQRIRLIFVADEIPAELRRVIEFLNGQMRPAEVLGIEVKQFAGANLRTLVPKVIGKTAEAETRKSITVTARRDDWSWEAFERELRVPVDRLAVGRAIAERVAAFAARRRPDWRILPRKGYYTVLRKSDYGVGVIDVWWRKAPRFAVKLPAPPSTLGLVSPYPNLPEDWDATEKQWGWTVTSINDVPDVDIALEMIQPFHPMSGPMITPQG